MKYLILILISSTLFFTTAKSSFSATTGQVYGYCQHLKANGFKAKNAGDVACQWYFAGVKEALSVLCDTHKIFGHMGQNAFINEQLIDMNQYDVEPLIVSFLNWADKNPSKFNNSPSANIGEWGAKDFPCKR